MVCHFECPDILEEFPREEFSAWRGVGREYITRFFRAATAVKVASSKFQVEDRPLVFNLELGTWNLQLYLLRRREARERVAVERFGLPGRLVPRPVLVSDYLHGHDEAVAAELVGCGDAVV